MMTMLRTVIISDEVNHKVNALIVVILIVVILIVVILRLYYTIIWHGTNENEQ